MMVIQLVETVVPRLVRPSLHHDVETVSPNEPNNVMMAMSLTMTAVVRRVRSKSVAMGLRRLI